MLSTYIRPKRRLIIVSSDVTKAQALQFLNRTPNGVVQDSSGKQYTKEELENVKSVKSKSGTKPSSTTASGDEISEDTDRELFGSFADYAESTSGSDNQWDKQS